MPYFLQQLLNGFHSGALYALLAFDYVLTNGVLKGTNLAHGPLFAFAGQALILFAVYGWNVLWLTLPATVALGVVAALAYAALTATILSRSVFSPLASASPNAIVVATLGAGIVLMELARIAADTRDFWLPPMLSQPVTFLSAGNFPVTLTVIQPGQLPRRRRRHRACHPAPLPLAPRPLLEGDQRRSGCRSPLRRRCPRGFPRRSARRRAVAALRRRARRPLLRQHRLRRRPGLRPQGAVRHRRRRLSRPAPGGYRRLLLRRRWNPPGAGYFPVEWRDGWMFAFLVALLVLTRTGRDETSGRT